MAGKSTLFSRVALSPQPNDKITKPSMNKGVKDSTNLS